MSDEMDKGLQETFAKDSISGPQVNEILYMDFDKKGRDAVKLGYNEDKELFEMDVALLKPTKKAKKRAKKDMRKAVRESQFFNKYRSLVDKEEADLESLPQIYLDIKGGDQPARKELEEYFHELMAQSPKKLMKKPRNWKKGLALSLGIPAAVGGTSALVGYLSYQLGYDVGHAIGHALGVDQAMELVRQAFDTITTPLKAAKNYLDAATEDLLDVPQSSLSIQNIASEQVKNLTTHIESINGNIERVVDGYDFTWGDDTTLRISADWDGDGVPDVLPDGNGGYTYDMDSGNPAIGYHSAVEAGSTDFEYKNIAEGFEQSCLNYQSFLDSKQAITQAVGAWNTVKDLAVGIESDVTAATTQIDNARSEVQSALDYMNSTQQGLAYSAALNTGGISGKFNAWKIKHQTGYKALKGAQTAGEFSLAVISPLAYMGLRVAQELGPRRIKYNKFKKHFGEVLEMDKTAEVITDYSAVGV
jgi:hypothetical protein